MGLADNWLREIADRSIRERGLPLRLERVKNFQERKENVRLGQERVY